MIKISNIGNHIKSSLPLRKGLGLCLLVLALTGCQQEEEDLNVSENQEKAYPVQLLMGMDELPIMDLTTRALPSGYSEYSPTSDPGKIGVFMTQKQTGEYTYTAPAGYFIWESASSWKSSVSVTYLKDATGDENKYYAYGFMPAGSGINAEITSTNFAAQATMTLTNVPPVSAQDFCIITGVKTGEPTNPTAAPSAYIYPSIADVGITEGSYIYTADTLSNAIYLLLKHVYSKYSVKMKVDSSYNTMRTIKITDMKLSASAPAMKVVVEYANGAAPTTTITALSEMSELKSDVFDKETALTPTAIDLTDFYCSALLTYIKLETTFDVYDKAGNKLRSKCTATNTVKVQMLEAGKHYTITMTIKPSYLYQLGDTDLNQPMVVI